MKLLHVNCTILVAVRRGEDYGSYDSPYEFFAFYESQEKLKEMFDKTSSNCRNLFIVDLGEWEDATAPALEVDKKNKRIKFYD